MTAEQLPVAYIDKYKDPETFNQEYHKYVSHLNQDLQSNGENSSFNEQTRLDFYRMKQQSMEITEERDDDEDEGLETLKDKYAIVTKYYKSYHKGNKRIWYPILNVNGKARIGCYNFPQYF